MYSEWSLFNKQAPRRWDVDQKTNPLDPRIPSSLTPDHGSLVRIIQNVCKMHQMWNGAC